MNERNAFVESTPSGVRSAPFDYEFHDFTENSEFTSAATSINSKVNADLLETIVEMFPSGSTILDYGAGKYGRVANELRAMGYKVYAYDPYNGKSTDDGWEGVSDRLPAHDFDHALTSFVLNVVSFEIQNSIVSELESRVNGKIIHIVRGSDIVAMVYNVISGNKQNKYIMGYIALHYPELYYKVLACSATKEDAKQISILGVATRLDSFQRWPDLSERGYMRSGSSTGTMWIK